MPNSMKVGESYFCPIRTEESIIYPSSERHTDNSNTSLSQMNYSLIFFFFQLHGHQAYTGDCQQHQAESIHSLKKKTNDYLIIFKKIIFTGWINPRQLTMKANKIKKFENFLLPLFIFLYGGGRANSGYQSQ